MNEIVHTYGLTKQYAGALCVNNLDMVVKAVSYTHLDVYKRQSTR